MTTGLVYGKLNFVNICSVSVQASQNYRQNEDLPPSNVSKREKKPYVRPIKHGSHAKRMKRREQKQLPPRPLKAPANGLLVKRLIPVAHETYEAYRVVLDGVSRLLKHLPVKACRYTYFANWIRLFGSLFSRRISIW